MDDTSVEDLRQQAKALIDQNNAKHKTLAEPPFGAALSPIALLEARLNSLISALLDEGAQLRVSIMTETVLGEALDNALEQVLQMQKEAESEKVRSELTRGLPGYPESPASQGVNPFQRS